MILFIEIVIIFKFIFFNKIIILIIIIKRFFLQMIKVDFLLNNFIFVSRNVSFLIFFIRNLIYFFCSFFFYIVEWIIFSKRYFDFFFLFYIVIKEQQILFIFDIKVRFELDFNYKIRFKGVGFFLFQKRLLIFRN